MTMTRRRLLDDTFKKSVVGNPAIATDSLARMYPGIEMQGWTEQDGTPTPEAPVPIVSAGTKNQETGKWEYELEMAGAQLFDVSQLQSVSTSADGDQRNGVEITGLEPGQYTISTKQKTIGTIAYLYAIVKNSSGEYGKVQYIVTNLTTNTVTISISSGDTLIIYDGRGSNSMEVSKDIFSEYGIMLNIGSTALPYQPYHTPQTVTLQSDRPLTKWDKLEKRNGQWGWVYKSSEVIFDGSEGEDWELYSNEAEGTSFLVLLPGSAYGYHASFCNKYKNVTRAWNSANKNQYCIYSDNANSSVKYFRPPSEGIEDVDGWRTWIRSNPLTLSYETSTETFIPLTTAEQEAMNALHTYRPTTVLSNQQDCQMSLTYKTRKSMEVTA